MAAHSDNQLPSEPSFRYHARTPGKISIQTTTQFSKDTLGLAYTPGVGDIVAHLHTHPEETSLYTWRGRTVAVISDGSAVLGLGNVGPEAALPVMEGKALLFKELAGIDAVPIVLGTQDEKEIVAAITALAPSFGGINLEDIAAPKCFAIEAALREQLSIPVVHDDQHGTAVVVLAGLINAHKVVGKDLHHARVAVVGAGAAGIAITRLLLRYGVDDIVVVDSMGVIGPKRANLPPLKRELAAATNREGRFGGVLEAVAGADVVIGVSGPGSIAPEHVRVMAQQAIVFALANPVPEIMPDEALAAGAAVVATGRSDFPNQVNNALVFPGLFRGLLDAPHTECNEALFVAVAETLAAVLARPSAQKILPTLFDRRVVKTLRSAVAGYRAHEK